uniref:Polyprotein n=1 Tax=Photeros flavivirus TaxID=3004161 RepID=A0A9C7GWV2_9FLAV|nr:polyprotein [Photeros flavivirus]
MNSPTRNNKGLSKGPKGSKKQGTPRVKKNALMVRQVVSKGLVTGRISAKNFRKLVNAPVNSLRKAFIMMLGFLLQLRDRIFSIKNRQRRGNRRANDHGDFEFHDGNYLDNIRLRQDYLRRTLEAIDPNDENNRWLIDLLEERMEMEREANELINQDLMEMRERKNQEQTRSCQCREVTLHHKSENCGLFTQIAACLLLMLLAAILFNLLVEPVGAVEFNVVKQQGLYVVSVGQEKTAVPRPQIKFGNITCHFSEYGIGENLDVTSQENCVVPVNHAEPANIRCWCSGGQNKITIGLGMSHGHRHKRSITPHPDGADVGTTSTGIKYIQERVVNKDFWRIEMWARQNIIVLILLAWIIHGKTRSIFWTAGILLLATMIGTAYADIGCVGVDSRDVLQVPQGTTWVDVVLAKDTCQQVLVEDKPTILMGISKVEVIDLELDKELALKCTANEFKSNDGCPGGNTAYLKEEHEVEWSCKRGTHSRGWGNGCGLFGDGTVVTCGKIQCEVGVKIYNVKDSNVQYTVHIGIQDGETEKNSQNFIVSPDKEDITLDLEDYGEARVICRPRLFSDFSNHQVLHLLEELRAMEVSTDWVNDIELPWRYQGGDWKRISSVLAWQRPTATGFAVDVLADQTASLQDSLHGVDMVDIDNTTLELHHGNLRCRLELNNVKVKGRTLRECEGTVEYTSKIEATNHQTVMVTVQYNGGDTPCRIRTAVSSDPDHMKRDRGNVLINNPIFSESGVDKVLEYKIFPGEAWIKIQDTKKHWTQKGSVVVDSFQSVLDGAKRIGVLGATWDFKSFGELVKSLPKYVHEGINGVVGTLFGSTSKLYMMLLGVAIIWLGMQQRSLSYQLILIILGGSMLMGNLGVLGNSIGCGVDLSRGVLKCGISGEFIWEDLQGMILEPEFRSNNAREPEVALQMALGKFQGKKVYIGARNPLEYSYLTNVGKAVKANLRALGIDITLTVRKSERKYVRELANVVTPQEVMDEETSYYEQLTNLFKTVEVKENGTTLVICESGDVAFSSKSARNRFVVQLGLVRYAQGMVDTAYVELENTRNDECCKAFMGAIIKNERVIHMDDTKWMDCKISQRGKPTNITEIKYNAYTECEWPSSHTIGEKIKKTHLFAPVELGFPWTEHNHIEGYALQTKAPWHKVPLVVSRGKCDPSDVIEITESCGGRAAAQRSTKDDGTAINKWCCRNCTLPPVKFQTSDGCWYAMEIRSQDSDAVETNYFMDAVWDAIGADARRKIVWSESKESIESMTRNAWNIGAEAANINDVDKKVVKLSKDLKKVKEMLGSSVHVIQRYNEGSREILERVSDHLLHTMQNQLEIQNEIGEKHADTIGKINGEFSKMNATLHQGESLEEVKEELQKRLETIINTLDSLQDNSGNESGSNKTLMEILAAVRHLNW